MAADSGISEKARLMCPNNPLVDNFTITSIHSTPSSESKRYQLVAITSTGFRLYFSHFKHAAPRNPSDTPDGIVLIHVRTPPPRHTTSNPASQQTNTASPTSPPSIFSCFYSNGVYMSVELNNNVETLTSCCPDIGYLARTVSRCEQLNDYAHFAFYFSRVKDQDSTKCTTIYPSTATFSLSPRFQQSHPSISTNLHHPLPLTALDYSWYSQRRVWPYC